ncbi:hypothetical protein VUR80DRAFT_2006 [Thermomyces stellatus]
MQSKLEMSPAGRHHKLSPPHLNLRRSRSYQHEKLPTSATSSRFSFNHLFYSPPPSPGLPALVPRAKKSPARARPTRVFRTLVWVAGVLFLVYVVIHVIQPHVDLSAMRRAYASWGREEHEEGLPDFPTPIMVKDMLGRSSWTVSIPKDYEFPLGVMEYAGIMDSCQEMSSTVRDLKSWTRRGDRQTSVRDYGRPDPNYVDVRQAEKKGLLPTPSVDQQKNLKRKSSQGNLVGVKEDPSMPECEKSMTVVLETDDAGLGKTLMMLWTFYGIAQDQGRAFFVDDSWWAYGKYTSMFSPPPVPDCRPPPRHEMVPCPSQASHLVVSSATAQHVLMDSLSTSTRADMQTDDEERTRRVLFDLARSGYEALFHVVKEDADYVERRVNELAAKAAQEGRHEATTPVAGVHIRRGDRHPLNFPYRDSYIPNEVYSDAARAAVSSEAPVDPLLVVASDDPTIYDAADFQGAHRAQERIKLASKVPGPKGPRNPHVFHRFVDEGFGWEGGFFSAMFWNLGSTRSAGLATPGNARNANEETVKLRGYLGRAYVLDLAVLAKSSDVVVCGVGSMGCRLLGVMMGWEAVEEGRWVNVDGEHGWMGLTW